MISVETVALVRWVADASHIGAALPEPFDRPYGTEPLIRRLQDAGVVRSVYDGMLVVDAARAAQRDCREWLAAHPDPLKM